MLLGILIAQLSFVKHIITSSGYFISRSWRNTGPASLVSIAFPWRAYLHGRDLLFLIWILLRYSWYCNPLVECILVSFPPSSQGMLSGSMLFQSHNTRIRLSSRTFGQGLRKLPVDFRCKYLSITMAKSAELHSGLLRPLEKARQDASFSVRFSTCAAFGGKRSRTQPSSKCRIYFK